MSTKKHPRLVPGDVGLHGEPSAPVSVNPMVAAAAAGITRRRTRRSAQANSAGGVADGWPWNAGVYGQLSLFDPAELEILAACAGLRLLLEGERP